jgi:hypothetical protein
VAIGQTDMNPAGATSVEDVLTLVANQRGIDYDDEYSYDSDDYPKPITDTTEEIHCGRCNVNLLET